MKHAALLVAAVLVLVAAPLRADDACWQDLFNGRDLTGWATIGGDLSAWAVEDGQIVAANPGHGGWIRTTRMFRDFELEADFLIPEHGNSGVGLRCPSVGDPAFTGFEVQILDSYGQDPKIDGCGAVYNAVAPAEQAVNAPGEWNHYRILITGDTLNVWLNGVWIQQNTLLDDRGFFRAEDQLMPLNERSTTGYIAFQDHGEGGLRLRNIRVRDLSPDPDPGDLVPAFDGESFEGGPLGGWVHRGNGGFSWEDGTLVAHDGGPGHLFSQDTCADVEIRALVRVAEQSETDAERTGNSGIYFRTQMTEGADWPVNLEAQIDNHDPRPQNYTGCIYNHAAACPPGGIAGPITRDGAWFDYRIVAKGDRVRTFIDGVPMVDQLIPGFGAGHLAIQTHHPGNRVEFRDVRVKILD